MTESSKNNTPPLHQDKSFQFFDVVFPYKARKTSASDLCLKEKDLNEPEKYLLIIVESL
jgi:hypothetical protein